MKLYIIGLATPALLMLGGYCAAWWLARAMSWAGRASLGTFRLVRPSSPRLHAHRRAAVMYGLRRGVVFSLGEFVVVVGVDLDEDARHWAALRLDDRPQFDLSEDFERRMRDGGDHG